MDYIELKVDLNPRDPWSGILVAQLAENGYESFVETENGILAYAQRNEIDTEHPFRNTFLDFEHEEVISEWEMRVIPQQNWNTAWESQFDPVEVEDHLTILAPFHDKSKARGLILEIMPRMSFGTGHHQTTWLMSKAIFDLDNMPDKVLDMGTGTGILAILAEKRGAKDVLAVDIEDWSVENTVENAERNQCQTIRVACGDIDVVEETGFGMILANINKNVLKAHLPHYSALIKQNGTLLLSGFFVSDSDELLDLATALGFEKKRILSKDNWATIELIKR